MDYLLRSRSASGGSMPKESSEMVSSLAEFVNKDEKMKQLHDAVELDLVQKTCKWSRVVLICGSASGALLGYLGGEEMNLVVNPLLLTVFGVLTSVVCDDLLTQMAFFITSYILGILRHSLYQGCSASLVPTIYGFIPCACGFLYRTPRAVLLSTAGVMAALAVIFSIDLSGNCISEPIAPHQKGIIFSERFIPLTMMILGNSAVLVAIVRQSQNSLLVHAKASRSAAKLAEIRRDVLHRVTHELRTPLNGIVGSVDLLAHSETMAEYDMENALTLKRCLDSILGICDDVLLAAKEDLVAVEKRFRLASCIDDVAEIFAATVEARGIKLNVEFVGDTTVEVRGMAVKLRQVLLNLVGNSLKFTESGSITIRVKVQEAPSSSSNTLSCTFEVEDTGVGVEEGDAEMLFEAFHQGEAGGAVSRRHKGTGLGLTICKDLVEIMGGKIAVEAGQSQGSRFFFTLELKKESNSVRVHQPSCRIVIADSEKESSASCESLVRSIAPRNADISVFKSCSELTEILEDEKSETLKSIRRIAFLEIDHMDSDFASTVSSMKQSGWLVFVYCEHSVFPNILAEVKDAHAVFRRPLQLVRMGEALRLALSDPPPPTTSFSPASIAPPLFHGEKTKTEGSFSRQVPSDKSASVANAGSLKNSSGLTVAEHITMRQVLSTTAVMPNGQKRKHEVLHGNGSDERESKKEKYASADILIVGSKRKAPSPELDFVSGSKVVVVDDTPVNVKVMVKMLSRSTSLPIVALSNGQAAIELVEASNCEDMILFLMDWHMPGVCGLTATKSIRKITQKRGGPKVYICMITADIEGLNTEMERRQISSDGTVVNGEFASSKDIATELSGEMSALNDQEENNEFAVLDIVTGKPITFRSIKAILSWFREQVHDVDSQPISGASSKAARASSL